MNNEVAICAQNVGKYYRLGQINTGMFFKDMQSYLAKKKGKEDPNAQIGAKKNELDGFWALRDINLEINRGDRVGIIGRNGAGKSTLLKILSQVTSPTTGRIGVNGRMASLLEVGTGFHPEMTGRENVYMNGAILGMKRSEITEKMKDIIEFSEIEQHIDTPVKRYSSGMYVRLAFAVAAHLESEILIADEVLAVGDAMFQKKALGKMEDISTNQGRTVLFVSHQMNAVKSLCDKGVVLDEGKVVFYGDVSSGIEYYQNGVFSVDEVLTYSRYNNEFLELLEFDIVNNKNESCNIISNDNEAYVKVYVNAKKTHTALNIGYALYDNEGTLIYWSVSTDVISEDNAIVKGENVFLAKIPSHYLNEGKYYIYLIESIHFQEWLIEPMRNSPRVEISIVGGLSESPFWMMKRPGICAPLIKWEKGEVR